MPTASLIVPSHVAQQRRVELAGYRSLDIVPTGPTEPIKKRGYGLGKSKHKVDPAEKIYTQLGIPVKKSGKNRGQPLEPNVIPGYHVAGNRVIIAVYERPETLEVAGGHELYLPDQTRREDEHQGKAGLIIAMGNKAFVSDDNYDFGGDADVFMPGVWVAIHVSDGRKIIINGQLCRMVEDQYIGLKIPAPDAVY
jgi:hypothetical protein